MNRSRALRLVALSLVGALLLYVLVQRVHLSPQQFLATLVSVQPGWLMVSFLLTSATVASRAYRFHVFFPEVSLTGFLPVTAVYNGLTTSLPGGLGEAGFAYLLKRRIERSLLAIGGRLLLTRVLDLLTISVVLLCISPLLGHLGRHASSLLQLLVFGALFVSLATLGGLWALQSPDSRLRRLLPPRWRDRIVSDASLSRSVLVRSLVVTLVNRVFGIASYIALFYALHLPLSVLAATAAYSTVNVLLAIPIQGILGAGSVDLWWTLVLSALGVASKAATAAAVAIHVWLLLFAIVPALAGGLWLFATSQASSARNQRTVRSSPSSKPVSGAQPSPSRVGDESK